jgi:hypothetical protein
MIINHDFGLTDRKEKTQRQTGLPPGHYSSSLIMVGFDSPQAISNDAIWPEQAVHIAASRFLALPWQDFAKLAPNLIMSPLVAGPYDALDIASYLTVAGYQGAYQAVVRRLPNTRLVEREIALACPGLNFSIVQTAR